MQPGYVAKMQKHALPGPMPPRGLPGPMPPLALPGPIPPDYTAKYMKEPPRMRPTIELPMDPKLLKKFENDWKSTKPSDIKSDQATVGVTLLLTKTKNDEHTGIRKVPGKVWKVRIRRDVDYVHGCVHSEANERNRKRKRYVS